MAKQADDNKFEDLFKKRLEGYEEAPPPMAWEKIAPEIGKNGIPYWRYLLPLLLLLLVSGGIFWKAGVNDEMPVSDRKPAVSESIISTDLLDHSNHSESLQSINRSEKVVADNNIIENKTLASSDDFGHQPKDAMHKKGKGLDKSPDSFDDENGKGLVAAKQLVNIEVGSGKKKLAEVLGVVKDSQEVKREDAEKAVVLASDGVDKVIRLELCAMHHVLLLLN